MSPVPPPVTLILGGARSGKTGLAQRLALASGLRPVYLATAEAGDAEMAERIARHQALRDGRWISVEAPRALEAALRQWAVPAHYVLVDCLTLWLTNLLLAGEDPEAARARLLAALDSVGGPVALVSNEVGQGIVPLGELTRRFVDEAGLLHQAIAAQAARVVLVVAGLPLELKPGAAV